MFLKRRGNDYDDDDGDDTNTNTNNSNANTTNDTDNGEGNNEAWEAGNMENKIRPFRLSGEIVEVMDRPCLER